MPQEQNNHQSEAGGEHVRPEKHDRKSESVEKSAEKKVSVEAGAELTSGKPNEKQLEQKTNEQNKRVLTQKEAEVLAARGQSAVGDPTGQHGGRMELFESKPDGTENVLVPGRTAEQVATLQRLEVVAKADSAAGLGPDQFIGIAKQLTEVQQRADTTAQQLAELPQQKSVLGDLSSKQNIELPAQRTEPPAQPDLHGKTADAVRESLSRLTAGSLYKGALPPIMQDSPKPEVIASAGKILHTQDFFKQSESDAKPAQATPTQHSHQNESKQVPPHHDTRQSPHRQVEINELSEQTKSRINRDAHPPDPDHGKHITPHPPEPKHPGIIDPHPPEDPERGKHITPYPPEDPERGKHITPYPPEDPERGKHITPYPPEPHRTLIHTNQTGQNTQNGADQNKEDPGEKVIMSGPGGSAPPPGGNGNNHEIQHNYDPVYGTTDEFARQHLINPVTDKDPQAPNKDQPNEKDKDKTRATETTETSKVEVPPEVMKGLQQELLDRGLIANGEISPEKGQEAADLIRDTLRPYVPDLDINSRNISVHLIVENGVATDTVISISGEKSPGAPVPETILFVGKKAHSEYKAFHQLINKLVENHNENPNPDIKIFSYTEQKPCSSCKHIDTRATEALEEKGFYSVKIGPMTYTFPDDETRVKRNRERYKKQQEQLKQPKGTEK